MSETRQPSRDSSLFKRAELMRQSAKIVKEQKSWERAVGLLLMHAGDLQALAECEYELVRRDHLSAADKKVSMLPDKGRFWS